MSAGLQSVPDELLEAARIDGAGAWTRFWRMTVPLLSPTIFFAVIVSTIYAFQSFGAVDILIGNQNAARLHTNVLIYNIVNTLAGREQPGRGGHHGHGPVSHHPGPDRPADAVPRAAGALCLRLRPARRSRRLAHGRELRRRSRSVPIIVLVPIYFTIVNSLLQPDQLAHQPPPLIPRAPQWHNYRDGVGLRPALALHDERRPS